MSFRQTGKTKAAPPATLVVKPRKPAKRSRAISLLDYFPSISWGPFLVTVNFVLVAAAVYVTLFN